MSWKNFLEQLKNQYCSEQELSVINTEFQNLRKRKLSLNEYAATFTEKMKLVAYLVPTVLFMVNKFASGLQPNYGTTVKLAATLKASIKAAMNVEIQIKEKGLERAEEAEKRKPRGSSISNKKSKILKIDPNSKNIGDNNEPKWYEMCKKKQFGCCDREVTC